MKSTGSVLARKSRALRAQSQGGAAPEMMRDAAAPLSDLVREEDGKGRERP